MSTLIDRIEAVRTHNDLNLKEFADRLKIARSTYSEVKNQKTKPNSDLLVGIATQFRDIDMHWVLTGEGSMLRGDHPPSLDGGTVDSVNPKQLHEVVEVVETALQEAGVNPSPKKRGELIAAAYDFYANDEVDAKQGVLLRLVKSAAQG